jgi:hypothetical protein
VIRRGTAADEDRPVAFAAILVVMAGVFTFLIATSHHLC